jgi:dihydrofolate reductase
MGARVIGGMTVSLDGFVADDAGSAGALYGDLAALQSTAYMQAMVDETGAVVMGRNTFAMAADPDWYVGNYEFQRPIFVVTTRPPERMPRQDDRLTFTFVTDGLGSAVAQATAAADGLAVTCVGGPALTCDLLAAGLLDELRVDVMPVLLGSGKSLFATVGGAVRLTKLSVVEVGERTSLRFSVSPS